MEYTSKLELASELANCRLIIQQHSIVCIASHVMNAIWCCACHEQNHRFDDVITNDSTYESIVRV